MEAPQAVWSLYLSKYHIVGNHISWLTCKRGVLIISSDCSFIEIGLFAVHLLYSIFRMPVDYFRVH